MLCVLEAGYRVGYEYGLSISRDLGQKMRGDGNVEPT